MNRTRLGALALAMAVILLLPSLSQAQRIRGWGWDGGWGGRSGFYYGYGYPSYGWSVGYGRPYYGYNTWAYGTYPAYSYRYTYQAPSSTYTSAYPADVSSSMPAPNDGTRVFARVKTPAADAKLWIEGQEINTSGLMRRFFSPPLDPGQSYTYTFRAEWTENGAKKDETRTARVHPGDRITVDFTAPDAGGGARSRRESGYGPNEGQAAPRQLPREEERVNPAPPKPRATPDVPPGERLPRDNGDKQKPNDNGDKKPDSSKSNPDNPG